MTKFTTSKFNCLKLRSLSNKMLDISYALILVIIMGITFVADRAVAQTRVDLEDLAVKGELLNDNRLRMSSRESTRVQDRVKYRKNFRPEILDGADLRIPASETADEDPKK